MSDYTLIQGDCLEVMPTLKKGSVDMVFADLPYGMTHNRWDSCIPLCEFWTAIYSITTSRGAYLATGQQPFTSHLVLSNRDAFRYEIIWQKTHPSGFLNSAHRPLSGHENVCVFSRATCNPRSKNAMTYNAQMLAGNPYLRNEQAQPASGNYDLKTSKSKGCRQGLRHPSTVLKFARCSSRIHPTQKPLALLEWLISTYTNPGDTVLDPVMGSGTTGHACANLGRKFIGIEKDLAYFAAAKSRIEKAYADAAAGPPQTSLAM